MRIGAISYLYTDFSMSKTTCRVICTNSHQMPGIVKISTVKLELKGRVFLLRAGQLPFLPQTSPLVSSVPWTSIVVSLLESFGLNSKHETRKNLHL